MVNVTVSIPADPWRDLALSYAPAGSRKALEALFALDTALGDVLRSTREPLVGQMRLAWWRDALQRLDQAPAPGEPVLQALAAAVLPIGVSGAALAAMGDGWEPLLGELGPGAIDDHARLRGRPLFEAYARVAGAAPGDPAGEAGEGWALADLAANLSDADHADRARRLAANILARVTATRWSRNGRSLGALSLIAQRELLGPVSPSFVLRLARFRLTGR
jgi:phytoene synthase